MAVLAYNHYRSISLPSRLIHPNKIENHELLQKQISNNLSQTVPITSEAIQSGLLRLAEGYNSLEEATHPATQRSILNVDNHDQDRKSMTEESLETSMELLDSCTSIRELVLMIRENVKALQSSLRRHTVGPTVENDVRKYSCFRKRTNRSIAKSLKTLKNLESKNRVLSEVAGFTIVILRSILMFLSWPTGKSGPLNMVSRLMQIKSMAVRREDSVVDVRVMHESLKIFDVILEEFEVGLERLFRQLVRNRVLLLNVLTHHLR